MAVLSDYVCLAHGKFESFDGKCPHGCGKGMTQKVFLKAPGYKSDRTGNIDNTLQMLANDYGLTDMNNQNGTSSAVREDWKVRKQREEMQQMMSQGQTQAISLGQGSNNITSAMASMGVQGDNALSQVRSQLTGPKPIVHGSWDGKS